jgi:hypothetical protein
VSGPWTTFSELQANFLVGKGSAASLLVDARTQVETQMRATYERLKSSPFACDTACA